MKRKLGKGMQVALTILVVQYLLCIFSQIREGSGDDNAYLVLIVKLSSAIALSALAGVLYSRFETYEEADHHAGILLFIFGGLVTSVIELYFFDVALPKGLALLWLGGQISTILGVIGIIVLFWKNHRETRRIRPTKYTPISG